MIGAGALRGVAWRLVPNPARVLWFSVSGLVLLMALGASPVAPIHDTPDLLQTDPRLSDLPDAGTQHCAPAAAADILGRLAREGSALLDDSSDEGLFRLVRLLGSRDFMDVDVARGTSASKVVDGLVRWLSSSGIPGTVHYAGWRPHAPEHTRARRVDEDTLADAMRPGSGALLNVGWYREGPESWTRVGGHWVALAGHAQGQIWVADPSRRGGVEATLHAVGLTPLHRLTLRGPYEGLPIWGESMLQLHGLAAPEGTDHVVVDGLVLLTLSGATDVAP